MHISYSRDSQTQKFWVTMLQVLVLSPSLEATLQSPEGLRMALRCLSKPIPGFGSKPKEASKNQASESHSEACIG